MEMTRRPKNGDTQKRIPPSEDAARPVRRFEVEDFAKRIRAYFAANARTLKTSSLRNGSNADSGTAVTAIVSPMALKTSIE